MPNSRRCLLRFHSGCIAACVLASLAACSRDAQPPLTEATVRAFATIRAEGLASMSAPTLCSQYTDGAEIKGAFGDPSSTLTGKGYCERIAEEFAKPTGGETLVSSQLAVKGFLIPLGGQSADLDLEQVDVIDRGDGTAYERHTQISSRVESVGGQPMITRESRRESLVAAKASLPASESSSNQVVDDAPRTPERRRTRAESGGFQPEERAPDPAEIKRAPPQPPAP